METPHQRRMRILQATVTERAALQHEIANRMAANKPYGELIERGNELERVASKVRYR